MSAAGIPFVHEGEDVNKNALVLVTMDDERREIAGGAVLVRDNVIVQVGPSADLPQEADDIIDASKHVVVPGLVNTHHHVYQSLTRVIPAAQNGELFNWLRSALPAPCTIRSRRWYFVRRRMFLIVLSTAR